MVDKKQNIHTTNKEASFGGYEYRRDYENLKAKGNSALPPLLTFVLRIILVVFVFASFVFFTFACMYRYHSYLRDGEKSGSLHESADIANASIQHTFIEYQSNMKFEEVDREESEIYSIPVGVRVKSLSSESGEYEAGFREGDIIVGFNGSNITCLDNLWDLMSTCKNNDRVVYEVFRHNEYLKFIVKLTKE
ncbi:MAG: PDZ domain-containing protein [Ruminococcaceae bacterium]|nr:PDZ domain-containing protein [Oscillospiraceae bacterium]